MRAIASLLAVILLLSMGVRSEDGITALVEEGEGREGDVADREPSNTEQHFLNLDLKLTQMFVENSEQIEQLMTELHHLRQSVEHLAWASGRMEDIVQKVENNNDLLVRNISILTQQSDNVLLNQQYCANHEALKNLFFELTPKCGGMLPTTSLPPPTEDNRVYRDCASAPPRSGVYQFTRPDGVRYQAYCEQELHNGSWMVFQSRQDGSVDFNRSWSDFREGFGDAQGEYWLGLETLYQLTRNSAPELMIVMEDFAGYSQHVVYPYFWVDAETTAYRIRFNSSAVTGTAGDSLYSYFSEMFVTYDHTSGSAHASCLQSLGSGFWHYSCGSSLQRNNLNGIYGQGRGIQGIWWGTFRNANSQNNSPLKKVKMMIRY